MGGEEALVCRKIVVIGAKEVGKTALLSRAVNNHFPEFYSRTTKTFSYFDIRRNLQFVDTPGIASTQLINEEGEWSTGFHLKALKAQYNAFKEDAVVAELLNLSSSPRNLVREKDLKPDAYLLVYNDGDLASKFVAKALYIAIATNFSEKIKVFMVNNTGDLRKAANPTLARLLRLNEEDPFGVTHVTATDNSDLIIKHLFEHEQDEKKAAAFVKHFHTTLVPFSVNTKTGENLSLLMDFLAVNCNDILGDVPAGDDSHSARSSTTDDRSCSTGNCTIS